MSPKKPSRAPGPRSSARTSSQIKGARRSSTATGGGGSAGGSEMRDHSRIPARADEYRGGAMQDDAEPRRDGGR